MNQHYDDLSDGESEAVAGNIGGRDYEASYEEADSDEVDEHDGGQPGSFDVDLSVPAVFCEEHGPSPDASCARCDLAKGVLNPKELDQLKSALASCPAPSLSITH